MPPSFSWCRVSPSNYAAKRAGKNKIGCCMNEIIFARIYYLAVTLPAPLLVGPICLPGRVAVKPLEPCGGRRDPAVPPAPAPAAPRFKTRGFSSGLFLALLEPCAVSSGFRAHCFCSLRWTNCSLHRTYLFSSSSNHYYLFPVPLEKMDIWHPARLHYWIPLPVSGWNNDKGRRLYWREKKSQKKMWKKTLLWEKKASCVIMKKWGSVSHPAHKHFIWRS